MSAVAAYPRTQHWRTDGFRVTVMYYRSNRGPCTTCGQRPARHAAWAERDDGMDGAPADFCDDHRPAKGSLPPLRYSRLLTVPAATGSPATYGTELLTPDPAWLCGYQDISAGERSSPPCGQPSTFRYEARCDGCDDPGRWRETRMRVVSYDGSERVEIDRHHEAHLTAEWFRCDVHCDRPLHDGDVKEGPQ